MDNYNKILNQIKEDLTKEDVECNENVISLYDLYNILYTKLKKLNDITDENKIFVNKGFFSSKSHRRILFDLDSKKMTIRVIGFGDNQSFDIIKEYDKEILSFSRSTTQNNKYINKFIKKHYDEVLNIFSVIEENKNLLISFPEVLQFSNQSGIYGLNIRLHNLSNISMSSFFNNDEEINYYNKEFIINLIDESKFELAKKINVNVNELPYALKNIISEHFVNKNKKAK